MEIQFIIVQKREFWKPGKKERRYCGKIGENLHTVEAGEGSIIVDGKKITIYAKPNAAELPWGELGVDVVLECTGFYTSKAKSQAHIDAGAKKVVISAPAGNDLKTIVYSVNEKTLTADDTIISAKEVVYLLLFLSLDFFRFEMQHHTLLYRL